MNRNGGLRFNLSSFYSNLLRGKRTEHDGYPYAKIVHCDFNSSRPEDIQYIRSYSYNKLEYLRFDSNVGWFVGYTEFGVKIAESWNNDTASLEIVRHEKYIYCAPYVSLIYKNIFSKSVKPYAMIHTASPSGSERVLVCSVYGFYPKDITVTWTNNNQEITTGVSNTEPTPNRDWTYQLHTYLDALKKYMSLPDFIHLINQSMHGRGMPSIVAAVRSSRGSLLRPLPDPFLPSGASVRARSSGPVLRPLLSGWAS
uniref:Ig-like domain-containing protein n=1 Tax=Neogobius melanostomus TaxID=47308 RepID=A0A8C6SIW5_9GOBI